MSDGGTLTGAGGVGVGGDNLSWLQLARLGPSRLLLDKMDGCSQTPRRCLAHFLTSQSRRGSLSSVPNVKPNGCPPVNNIQWCRVSSHRDVVIRELYHSRLLDHEPAQGWGRAGETGRNNAATRPAS